MRNSLKVLDIGKGFIKLAYRNIIILIWRIIFYSVIELLLFASFKTMWNKSFPLPEIRILIKSSRSLPNHFPSYTKNGILSQATPRRYKINPGRIDGKYFKKKADTYWPPPGCPRDWAVVASVTFPDVSWSSAARPIDRKNSWPWERRQVLWR